MLSALPTRAWTRLVVDSGASAAVSHYTAAVSAIAPVASIMIELCDSSYVEATSLATYQDITTGFLSAFRASSCGRSATSSTANGSAGLPYQGSGAATGLGNPVLAKAYAAWKLVNAAGKKSALTLYYQPPQAVTNGYDMVSWAQANFASLSDMSSGLDEVLVSYYEPDNNGIRPTLAEWTTIFRALEAIFPKAAVGFGEVGLDNPATSATLAQAESIMKVYYALAPGVPRWWGGYFWWYAQEDLVPDDKPLFGVLSSLLASGDR